MAFIPPLDTWVTSHYVGVPTETIEAIGSIEGKRILDVGCGDLLTAFGLLNHGAAEVVGLDIKDLPEILVDDTVKRLAASGYEDARFDRPRLTPLTFDGRHIPFDDSSFDVVFSWGVFEHVVGVRQLLTEMRRVMKPDGVCFIKVFPWFHSFYGSHLADFIQEPFAHLKYDHPTLLRMVTSYLDEHPEHDRNLILNHVWPEFLTLNKYSANMFYDDVRACGFSSAVWKLISYAHDLSHAPDGYSLSDLMIAGSEVILRK
ncbi:class I SAM-dependent methyltransferase [Enterovirga aerilata]|uniref:Class I SAM-dependent methyltransferase n=1 Tax=Enterovirga aerilata TaxID=2730920 RepID=A0A849IAZ2_9HYPH|nr:class I SAM-dependent methyltransferase [Enterovirga sp. DB1703]NNM75074.1 class I SAM-dependent methyltransferase [Enterovirga sp. DB1703]